MKDADLSNRMKKLGFPLFEREEKLDANRTLADVVKSKELRLWEGFPVMLANAAENGLFDYDKTSSYLKTQSEKKCFLALTSMSLALYKVLGLKFVRQDELSRLLNSDAQGLFKKFLVKLRNNLDLNVHGRVMSGERLKSTFAMYFGHKENRALENLLATKEALGLEYALSQVFSPKQKELFFKKLRSEKLSKTEKEYFSRAVKKKVLALANTELHRLAMKLLEL